MKYSDATIPCSEKLRFFALLMMCCTILVDISATESLKNDDAHDARQELPKLIRERRAIKKNGATNPHDTEKRLQIIERRLDALLSYPNESDNRLIAHLLGQAGPKGDQGAVGKTRAQGPQETNRKKMQDSTGTSGVNYVRWGRTSCPIGAQIVYQGITGGGYYTSPGGGSQYLCLPSIPKYDKYQNGYQFAGYVFGTEYEVSQYNGNPFDRNLHNHDAPCAVCFVTSRGSMLMMPARNDCPSGWTKEYHGYLMTAYYAHAHSTEFICVDGNPEYVHGSQQNRDGALLYPVEGRCGSLPCLPYVEGRELTCAVCTK